jgi:hypothetical protein
MVTFRISRVALFAGAIYLSRDRSTGYPMEDFPVIPRIAFA